MYLFDRIDDNDDEQSASKHSPTDTISSDGERSKRDNSDSLEIKRERNESGSSKTDENDTESDAHNGKSQVILLYIVRHWL